MSNHIDRDRLYSLTEAVDLAVSRQRAKFVETLDISMKLGIDPTKPDQHVKGFIDLPKGRGIAKKILAIVSDKDREAVEKAGADYVGEEFIEKINQGWIDFDIVVATPDMMAKIGKIGKKLGTKGLMPNIRYGTISKDITSTVENFKKDRVIIKNDKYGLVNSPVGKSNFKREDLFENAKCLLQKIVEMKPSTSKGQYLKAVSLSLTMGPSVKVDPIQLLKDLRS